jgi:hypothetical protein
LCCVKTEICSLLGLPVVVSTGVTFVIGLTGLFPFFPQPKQIISSKTGKVIFLIICLFNLKLNFLKEVSINWVQPI